MPAGPPALPVLLAWVRRPAVWQSTVGLTAALIGVLALVLFMPHSRPPVATVDGTAISRSTFEHWLRSAARTAAAQNHGIPDLPPDPPRYPRCIAALQRVQRSARQRASLVALRGVCAQDYTALRNAALQLLIDSQWILKQGGREHVVIPAGTVARDLVRYQQSSFPAPGSLQRYLRRVGQTMADVRFQIGVSLTSTRLEAQHVAPVASVAPSEIQSYYATHRSKFPGQTLSQAQAAVSGLLVQQHAQQALAVYTQQFERYWRVRTKCAMGFRVSSLCGNSG